MDYKIFLYFFLVFCAQYVVQIQSDFDSGFNGLKVDNCIFSCRIDWNMFFCNGLCDGPGSYIDKKYSINDILEKIDNLRYSNIDWIAIASNNIYEFNANYFCPISNNSAIQSFSVRNNKLNDSSKLGLGDINNCEDDNSKCEYAISKLELYNNPLQILKNNSFCHLKNLTVLDLFNCSLNSIEADAFKFNNKLEKLDLNNNQLTEIPHLGHLSSLKTLYINKNLITSIKNEDFVNCDKLQILDLKNNRISNIEDKSFDRLTKLNYLDLSNNHLTKISPTFRQLNTFRINISNNFLIEFNILNFSKKLSSIIANDNLITQVFSNVLNSKLIEIDLRRNKIKSIDELELPKTLEMFQIEGNDIEYFSVRSINRSNTVLHIFLDNNKLQILANNGEKGIRYSLNGNPLICSCENSWLFSNSEEEHYIDDKKCSSINKYNPSNKSTLNVNMLCESNFNNSNRCRIKHSNESKFQCQFECLNSCYCYTTANFSLAIYFCSKSQLHSVPQWENSGQLYEKSEVIVWLDGNNISQVTNTSFIDYYNVIQLYLNNSHIEEIHHFAFDNMSKLILLDLSQNQLTTIEENSFDQLINLEKLLLSSNKLRQLPDNCFDNLKFLKFVYLHDNKLTNYPVWKMEKLSSIKELTIYNNSWNCNCSFLTKFHNFLKIHWKFIPSVNEINCINGNKMNPVSNYYSSKCLRPCENYSIKCNMTKNKSKMNKVVINAYCNNSFALAKHDIDNVIKSNCFYNYSSINEIELTDSNIGQLNTDYFCLIGEYNVKHLNFINNQFNDSSKLGFGDLKKCNLKTKCKFQTLEILILNENPLKTLKNNSFCHLRNLKDLHLCNCSLKSIDADAFFNLFKLEFLNLNDNQLNRIPYYPYIKSLQLLDIANNTLNSIENMEHFQKLKVVDLSYNKIKEIRFSSLYINMNLTALNFSHNLIQELNPSFRHLSKVNFLNLNYNQISQIDFSYVPKSLLVLFLRGNHITNFNSVSSHDSLELQWIDLSRNKIQLVSGSNSLPNLVKLEFNDNQINKFSISIKNVDNVKEINMFNNNLRMLAQSDIKADIFNITNNPIACHCQNSWLFKNPQWSQMVGEHCTILNKFNPDNHTTLSSNMLCESNYKNSNRCVIKPSIKFHFKCQFECPFPCYCYTTDDFSIAHYYCSNSQLEFLPQWINSDQLDSQSEIIVWLNGNNFSKIRNENFTDYDNVTQLYLESSEITSIGPLTFAKMTKLKILDLSYNQITIIVDGTFNHLINLQKLILSHNQIAYLPDNCFNNTMALQSLQLHNNKLTNYSIWDLKNRKIEHLTIYNNSWSCQCSFITEFQNYIEYHLNIVSHYNDIICSNEDGSLANSPVIQYNTSHCTNQQETTIDNTWPIVIGIIAPLSVFGILYGVIHCIKSRVSAKRVKRIERAYRLMQNAGTPIETNGKVFDVFISYCSDDSVFVATEIVPKLENINDPYHVCVHERNFLGGGSIEDTIMEAIKKSTRIIVILTENYLKSDWCMYEFVIAHSVMIEDQCPRVVLIIKDELPPDINPNLQIYLSTNTYIEWTDKRFWQRLYFALSSNKLPMEQTQQPMNFLMSTRFIMPHEC
ncbi:TOLL-like receptor [Chamberlinius hualienensis]